MAWESVRVLDSDFPVGYTENDYYFTGNRTSSHSMTEGGFSDITFVLSFELCDYAGSKGDTYFYSQPAGDYYLVGNEQAGIFVRKTGAAGASNGSIIIKASYDGQADSGSSKPENLSSEWGVRSNYSEKYSQFSIICGINEETHKGTIFTYRKWNEWCNTGGMDFAIKYCDYNRYTNSEVAYNLIKGIMPVLYNWQSVSSVSGRTGTLQLVTLDSESINSGNPVSGAAISVFNQNPVSENNVKDIVDANIPITPSAVNVTAKFVIGAMSIGDLASRVIVAKKGSIPESIDDGDTVMTIPAGTNEITIPNLDEDSEYYFSIFVADSYGNEAVSDPKNCSTGIRPIEPSNEVITVIAKAYSDGYQEKVTATKEEN